MCVTRNVFCFVLLLFMFVFALCVAWVLMFFLISMFHLDPSQDLDRRQKAQRPLLQQTFAYKGWADNDFSKPKQPLRYTPSADINTDVKRYFRTGKEPSGLLS